MDLHEALICTRPLFMTVEEKEGDASARMAPVGRKWGGGSGGGRWAVSLPQKVSGNRDVHRTTTAHFQGGTHERAEAQPCQNVGVLVLPGEELQGENAWYGDSAVLQNSSRYTTQVVQGNPRTNDREPRGRVCSGWQDKIERSCYHYPFSIIYK